MQQPRRNANRHCAFVQAGLRIRHRSTLGFHHVGLYHHCVFPYLLDMAMTNRVLHAPRRRTLARASGRILEMGFGTGANLAHYPPGVERIEAIDPDVDLDRYSRPAHRCVAHRRRFPSPGRGAPALRQREFRHRRVHADALLHSGRRARARRDPARAAARRSVPVSRARAGSRRRRCPLAAPARSAAAKPGRRLSPDPGHGGAGARCRPAAARAEQYYLPGVPRFLGYVSEGSARARFDRGLRVVEMRPHSPSIYSYA